MLIVKMNAEFVLMTNTSLKTTNKLSSLHLDNLLIGVLEGIEPSTTRVDCKRAANSFVCFQYFYFYVRVLCL